MNIIIKTAIIILLLLSIALLLLLLFLGTNIQSAIFPDISLENASPAVLAFLHSPVRVSYIVFSALSCISGMFLFVVFRKTTSPEILFLILSTVIFSFPGTGFFADLLSFGHAPAVLEPFFRKAYYFFYIQGVMLFFFGGFFSNGIPFLKQNIFLTVCFFTSAAIILLLPLGYTNSINSSISNYTYTGLLLVLIRILEAAAVINYLFASIRNSNLQYVLLAASLLTLFVGLELVLTAASLPFIILGIVTYFAGMSFFTHRIYVIRLWN